MQNFNRIWTHDLAIPVRCSNQLSYEATDVGSLSIMCSYVPVKEMNVIDVYEINHMRTAEMKSNEEWSSQLWVKFVQLHNKPEKNFRTSTGFKVMGSNPVEVLNFFQDSYAVSTVFAKNAWDHDPILAHTHEKKRNAYI